MQKCRWNNFVRIAITLKGCTQKNETFLLTLNVQDTKSNISKAYSSCERRKNSSSEIRHEMAINSVTSES